MTCTYRGHGQALAKGLSTRAAMAEMLGKATGCSKGKGGSIHSTDPGVGLLGANAIVAAGVPHAAGAALAAQLQGRDNVALTVFGEGAVNQGVFHCLPPLLLARALYVPRNSQPRMQQNHLPPIRARAARIEC
jgi:TPP-dependent pyruvate/acetoin dehydrogenase alpha subunit